MQTLKQAYEAGVRAAKLAYFGEGAVNTAKWMAVGQGPQAFVQGAKSFAPGGALHWRNVMWPTMPGKPGMQMLGRAGTLLSAAALPGMMKRDQAHGEGRLSSLLGGVGSLAGMMYGGTAGGMLGTPVGSALGHRLGTGLGHLLGSKGQQDPNTGSL